MSKSEQLLQNIDRMNAVGEAYQVVIVCTSTLEQAAYWQHRLAATRGSVSRDDALVVAVHEDWNGGAGNGLGTLYAYVKAVDKAKELYGVDITERLKAKEFSVALYHTAGKGTRLAPLPGSENNNKPGVKLPSVLSVNGRQMPMTILEAVIKQTGVYAAGRKGRLSVFWGDQVFIPSNPVDYDAVHEVDILASCRPMPSEEEWTAQGLDKYGLIAVNVHDNAAQVDKVSYATATRLLSSFGELKAVGTSLGSFSVSVQMLVVLLNEFAAELESKTGKLDADPHFWMPMTLSRSSYLEIMAQKGVAEKTSAAHFDRVQEMLNKAKGSVSTDRLFGCVDVGDSCYWWDYGQLKLYLKNNLLLVGADDEAKALRNFLGIKDKYKGSLLGLEFDTCNSTCVLSSQVYSGRASASVLSNVCVKDIDTEGSLLMNVSAHSIKAKNCLIYNVADDSEEGIVLEEGSVLAGVFLPGGEKMIIRSNFDIDGGKFWSQLLSNNPYSFEGVYKLNSNVDVHVIESEMLEEMNRVSSTFQNELAGALRRRHRFSVDSTELPENIEALTAAIGMTSH